MTRDPIEIACGATENFFPHLAAMLHSLLTHTRHRPVRVGLMMGHDPRPQLFNDLRKVVEQQGATLSLLLAPSAMTQAFPRPRLFHPWIWHRLLLPELLPEASKVLYLDADMIVTDDLLPLWQVDLGDHLFGAVTAPFYPLMSKRRVMKLGIDRMESYVSTGTLLMNLAQMRNERCVDELRRYAQAHPGNACPEQDALCALYHRRCMLLHPRWNVQPILYEFPLKRMPYPRGQALEAVRNPAVVHFAGVSKPWTYLSKHPLRAKYFEHLRHTPWPVRALEGATPLNRLLRPLPTYWQYASFGAIDWLRRLRSARLPTASLPRTV